MREGGFALVAGDVGTSKSVTLRMLAERLGGLRDVTVGTLTHPRSRVADFFRELGELVGTTCTASNRGGGFKALCEKWHAHIEAPRMRLVLLIDEAQEMYPEVLSELPVPTSSCFDSRAVLTVVLDGDARLLREMFRREELVLLGNRMRVRMTHEYATRGELRACLVHRITQAGNATLATPQLLDTLCEHAAGNYRVLLTMAAELLDALAREQKTLDEKLYLEVFAPPAARRASAPTARAARR